MPIIRSYDFVERGRAAIWLEEPIREPAQVLRLARQLRDYPEPDGPVDIVIAGSGGNCTLGGEMHTLIRENPRRTRVTILDAPSMAGVIAMAATERRIVEGGTIFLHGAGYAAGHVLNEAPLRHLPAAALRALARNCESTDAAHVAIFARATGLDPAEVRRLRDAETTLDAAEALRLGFVQSIVRTECRPANPARSTSPATRPRR